MRASAAVWIGFVALTVGCGGAADGADETGAAAVTKVSNGSNASGASSSSGADHGAVSRKYPAFAPEVMQLQNVGGATLPAAKLVTVTWASDENASTYEAFDDQLGTSAYWAAAVGEYGIGATVGAGHVEMMDSLPKGMSDTKLEAYIKSHVNGAPDNGWPVHDDQTLYVVYVPESVGLTSSGKDACPSYSGYHSEIVNDDKTNSHTLFAIINEKCHDKDMSVADFGTETASHEIGEAVTDPHTESDIAWSGFDDAHVAWEVFQGHQDENGDACEFYADSFTTLGADFPFAVQRMWSNAAAAAGKNPCVPSTGAYFNVTPLELKEVSLVVPPARTKTTTTKAVPIKIGKSASFPVGFYSSGSIGAWDLSAAEGDGFSDVSHPKLTIAIDKTSGANGEKAWITVTVNSGTSGTGILLTLMSTKDGVTHYMPLLIDPT